MYPELKTWFGDFCDVRHDLHAHPEVGFDVHRTSDIVADQLIRYGYQVTRNIGKTGLVAQLKLGDSKKSMGIRADMDALPMQELGERPYKSTVEGKAHACGHDGNTTMLLAAARLIAHRKNFNGTLNLIFQPAEEGQGGAAAMVKEGVIERFPCDYLFAAHSIPNTEGNKLYYCQPGPQLASSDRFTIVVKGRGGHGAEPQNTIDPVIAGSAVVQALQSIVARNIHPKDRAVVTVASFIAGGEGSYNIIPQTAKLLLSVRTMDPAVRETTVNNIHRITEDVCRAYGATAEIAHQALAAAVINDARAATLARTAAISVFGEEMCPSSYQPLMNSEDFTEFSSRVPSAYCFLNNGDTPNCHNPAYDFNDELIIHGASYWTALTELYLK
ncbi:amidohydrolase [Cedecea colo]|uniref:Amidohydrolase n=1 Tax=Cedecea colo TaxID=2552946 RepID=A0ABX0VLB6_9ENTR|nr:amidohydrolase [Cedecea colo]NIY47853.1 amidohydrolase [Cedecea colo]